MKPYYIYPIVNNKGHVIKTHLAKVNDDETISTFCLPNIPRMVHDDGCCPEKGCDCDGHEVNEYDLRELDTYCNEVTCQKCLERAKGKPAKRCSQELKI